MKVGSEGNNKTVENGSAAIQNDAFTNYMDKHELRNNLHQA